MPPGPAEEHGDRAAAFRPAGPGADRASEPAARLTSPSAEHALDMLRGELDSTRELLRGLSDAEWQQQAGTGQTVRELVLDIIFQYEEVSRNLRMPLARVLNAGRRRPSDAARPGAPARQLADELGYRGNRAAQAAARHRDRKRPVFRSGPLAGRTAGYLSGVALPREAWLDRIAIAKATGRSAAPGPHGPEIVRQAVRDVSDAWSGGRAVLVELTGPAGGRWVAGDGPPAATVRTDPADFLRLVTGRPNGHVEATGDASAADAFLTTRI
jgi:hypothetical protein